MFPDATTLSSLIDQAVAIDQQKNQCLHEDKLSAFTRGLGPGHDSSFSLLQKVFDDDAVSVVASDDQAQPSIASHRRRLTSAEKERRRIHNLCMYCASSEHTVQNCPDVPEFHKSNSAVVSTITLPSISYPLQHQISVRTES